MLASRPILLLSGALALACGLVVVLSRRQLSLSEAYVKLRAKAGLPYVGYVMPTVRLATLGGDSVTVGEVSDSSVKQLLFVLTATCPFCLATLPVWKGLADSAKGFGHGSVMVVGVGLDSATTMVPFSARHALNYPVAVLQQWKTINQFRAVAVPQTLVLNHRGQVLFAHTGRLKAGVGLDSVYRALRGPNRVPRQDVADRRSAATASPVVGLARDSLE